MPKPPPTSGVITRILLGRNLEHVAADDIADDVAALAAERQRIALAVVFRDDAAGIEIIGDQPLVDQRDFGAARGLGESLARRFRIADRGFKSEIARPVRPNERRAGLQARQWHRSTCGSACQSMVDRLGGISRVFQRIGDDKGNRIADVAHDVARQDRIERQ